MVNAGILDGDLVVVQRAQDARNGEIVVALAGDDESADEATVKRFFRENGRMRLQPENDAMEPIYAQPRPDPRHGDGGVPGAVSGVAPLHRTLEQELQALLRGVSLECLVCGEFVLTRGGMIACPECGIGLRAEGDSTERGLQFYCRPGDRGRLNALEESPDTAGQDAGATQAAKADGKWHRKETAGDGSPETPPVRVKRWGKSPPASWRHGG